MNDLFTAQELEQDLGKTYFYRQRIYRMAEGGELPSFSAKGVFYFNKSDVIAVVLKRLEERIVSRFPSMNSALLKARYDFKNKKLIEVEGFPGGRDAFVDTETETEEDLLEKIERIGREMIYMQPEPKPEPHREHPGGHHPPPHEPEHVRHHRDVMDVLHRIEETLRGIEERLR
jgi:hypothetical protein